MTSSIQSWTWTSETERSAISHWPIVLSPLHGAMPVVVPPKVARLICARDLLISRYWALAALYSILETGRQLVPLHGDFDRLRAGSE